MTEKKQQPEQQPSTAQAPLSTKEKKARKKSLRNVTSGIVHVQASFNNTIISITDKQGHVISWSSPGAVGFSGSKKSTPFAAQVAATQAAKAAKDLGMQTVEIWVKGPGSGRESAIRAVQGAGLLVTTIKDMTPIPHNGCRARKKRRV